MTCLNQIQIMNFTEFVAFLTNHMGELCEIFLLQVTLTFAIDLTTECINFGSCRNHYFTSFLDQILIIGTKIDLSEDFQKILLKTAETVNLKS